MPLRPPRAILFDLDGTLADTAPDLAAAANYLRQQRGLENAPYESLRPVASAGARGLIGAALGIHPGDAEYEDLRVLFLDRYQANMATHSGLFDGIPELLAQLEARGIGVEAMDSRAAARAWGVLRAEERWIVGALLPL